MIDIFQDMYQSEEFKEGFALWCKNRNMDPEKASKRKFLQHIATATAEQIFAFESAGWAEVPNVREDGTMEFKSLAEAKRSLAQFKNLFELD